jgi:putative NIF3 family GTP cyclohydrolase 1 type 2
LGEGKGTMAARKEIENTLNTLLQADRFDDYGPNGLQVEGRAQVRRIVSGVTASLALIDAAIADGADAILVHHGLFWRGQDGRLVGWLGERVRRLMAHGINLFAYHLPLDAHPELGNNAQLARVLGWNVDGRFAEQGLGCWCDLARPVSPRTLATRVARGLARAPLAVGRPHVVSGWDLATGRPKPTRRLAPALPDRSQVRRGARRVDERQGHEHEMVAGMGEGRHRWRPRFTLHMSAEILRCLAEL